MELRNEESKHIEIKFFTIYIITIIFFTIISMMIVLIKREWTESNFLNDTAGTWTRSTRWTTDRRRRPGFRCKLSRS